MGIRPVYAAAVRRGQAASPCAHAASRIEKHPGHRGADFVAHGCQKSAFRRQRGFRGGGGANQLSPHFVAFVEYRRDRQRGEHGDCQERLEKQDPNRNLGDTGGKAPLALEGQQGCRNADEQRTQQSIEDAKAKVGEDEDRQDRKGERVIVLAENQDGCCHRAAQDDQRFDCSGQSSYKDGLPVCRQDERSHEDHPQAVGDRPADGKADEISVRHGLEYASAQDCRTCRCDQATENDKSTHFAQVTPLCEWPAHTFDQIGGDQDFEDVARGQAQCHEDAGTCAQVGGKIGYKCDGDY